jgi:hypothetical protein
VRRAGLFACSRRFHRKNGIRKPFFPSYFPELGGFSSSMRLILFVCNLAFTFAS